MYSLLARITDGLNPLRVSFEAHVKKAGLSAIERISQNESESVDPKSYVDTLLEVHKKYNDLVQTAFSGEAGFVAALDKACGEFVNRNKVCKGSSSKSPELLARFCDQLLKKSAKNPEEDELEDVLNNVMTVFKYVEDKDVFQKFYSKMLAKRLVNGTSASDDAEGSMISKLKEACGFEYTSKLQRMLTDMSLSKELNDQFKDLVSQSHEGPSGGKFVHISFFYFILFLLLFIKYLNFYFMYQPISISWSSVLVLGLFLHHLHLSISQMMLLKCMIVSKSSIKTSILAVNLTGSSNYQKLSSRHIILKHPRWATHLWSLPTKWEFYFNLTLLIAVLMKIYTGAQLLLLKP